MVNIPEELKKLQDLPTEESKSENNEIANTIKRDLPEGALNEISSRLVRHSTVTNSAIALLSISLTALATLSLFGYLRLDDQVTNESHLLNQRLDGLQQSIALRIDSQQQLVAQRLDAQQQSTSQRLDACINNAKPANPPNCPKK